MSVVLDTFYVFSVAAMYLTPDYCWSESPTSLRLLVSIVRANKAKLQLSLYDNFLKLTYEKFFLCIDFVKEVDDMDARVLITDAGIEIRLKKIEEGEWKFLLVKNFNKQKLQERRLEAMRRKEVKEAELQSVLNKTKEDVKQQALHTQWNVEQEYKDAVAQVEQKDKLEAEVDLNSWLDGTVHFDVPLENSTHCDNADYPDSVQTSQIAPPLSGDVQSFPLTHSVSMEKRRVSWSNALSETLNFEKDVPNRVEFAHRPPSPHSKKAKKKGKVALAESKDVISDSDTVVPVALPRTRLAAPIKPSLKHLNKEQTATVSKGVVIEEVSTEDCETETDVELEVTNNTIAAPIRTGKIVEAEFTATATRGPARSSYVPPAPKLPNPTKSGDISENPTFLKDKGDSFFQSGNFISAIAAYSAALDNDPNFLPCLSNRSACWLKIFEASLKDGGSQYVSSLQNCISDCVAALALINVDGGNSAILQFSKLALRKSVAHASLGEFESAIADLDSVLAVKKSEDVEQKKATLVSLYADYKAKKHVALKNEGDLYYKNKDITKSIEAYTKSLTVYPVCISCLSNRASAYIVAQNYCAALNDCSICIGLIEREQLKADKKEEAAILKRKELEKQGEPTPYVEPKILEADIERKKLKVRLITKRVTCYIGLSRLFDAKRDLEEAIRLEPHDANLLTSLTTVITRIRRQAAKPGQSEEEIMSAPIPAPEVSPKRTPVIVGGIVYAPPDQHAFQRTPNPSVEKYARQAVSAFQRKDFAEALRQYDLYLDCDNNEDNIVGLLNRSLCHLQMKNYKLCIADCTRAIKILYQHSADADFHKFLLLIRRGSALALNADILLAIKDYEDALFVINAKLNGRVTLEERAAIEKDLLNLRSMVIPSVAES